MYDVGGSLPVDHVEPGAFLVAGPAMSGKYDLSVDLIADGMRRGDGAVLVSTNDGAESVIEDVRDRYDGPGNRLRLVDCVSDQQATTEQFPSDRVEYVNSPGDLTGLGIGVSEHLRRFVEDDVDATRLAFDSVSTLLMYSDVETVFQFLHVLTGRIDNVDGLGTFTLDPTTHDTGTVNTLKQLFDGMIEVRAGENGREIRFVGIETAPDGWIEY